MTRLMDLKRDTRAKDEQITLVRNRLERLKLEEQKVYCVQYVHYYSAATILCDQLKL